MTRKKARISEIIENKDLNTAEINVEIRTVHNIFKEILDLQAHERLFTQLKIEFYDKLNIEEFSEDFFECMRHIMIYNDRVKTETPLLFCIKFVIFCISKSENNSANIKSALLLKRLVKYITFYSDSVDPLLRFHSVQASRILLTELSEDFPVPDALFERIQTKLLSRFWDVKTYVRCEAVRASSRLQDPTDAKCPIVMGLMHICKYDSLYTVRLAALQSLAITTKTLPCVIERIRDVNDMVRKKAFELLAKWKILKPLSISSRLSIIEAGLTDKSDIVKNACKELLKIWLVASENDLIKLLKRFDVENMESPTELALRGLLECLSANEVIVLIDQLRALMNDELMITENNLSAESAFLWRHLVSFVVEKSSVFEGQAERILPSVINFEQYLRRLFQKPMDQNMRKDISLDEYAEYCTIIKNLLPIVVHIDIFDTYNRNLVINLVKWAMSSVDIPFNYVDHLMKLFVHLDANNIKICDQTVELINELLYCDNDVVTKNPLDNQENMDPEIGLTKGEDAHLVFESLNNKEILRKMKIEIAEVDVKINELKEEINTGIHGNVLEGLTEMISDLKNLELKKKDLIEQRDKVMGHCEEGVLEVLEDTEYVEKLEYDVKIETEQTQMWMASGMEGRIMKANIMVIAMIKECNLLWTMPSSLRSLLTDVILVSVRHTDTCVREKAILALGLCCLLDKDIAVRYYTIFLKSLEVDHDQVKEVAVKSLVDVFIRFGIEPFQESRGDADASDDDQNKRVSELINPIVALLAVDRTDLVTASAIGLSKLIYHHKIVSSKLLSRLLLMWFSPEHADNSLLKAHLGSFFTSYSLMSADNQHSVADCFFITMATLFKAPASSALTEIDIANVVDYFIRVTDSKYLLDHRIASTDPTTVHIDRAHLANPCHDELGTLLAREIMNSPLSAEAKYYVSMLVRLRFSADKVDLLADIDGIVAPVIEKIKEKKCVQMLNKFHSDVVARLGVTRGVVVGPGGGDDDVVRVDEGDVVVIGDAVIEGDTESITQSATRRAPRTRTKISTSARNSSVPDTDKTVTEDTILAPGPDTSTTDTTDSSPEVTLDNRRLRRQVSSSSSSSKNNATPTVKKSTDDDLFKRPMEVRATRSSTRTLSTPTSDKTAPTSVTRQSSTRKKK